jgi:hypothetical protein
MHTSPLRRTEQKEEDAGMIAIATIEKTVHAISARTFLATWEITALMKSIAYQRAIEIIPSAAVASAIQQILNMMTELVDNTDLTAMEVRDLITTVC